MGTAGATAHGELRGFNQGSTEELGDRPAFPLNSDAEFSLLSSSLIHIWVSIAPDALEVKIERAKQSGIRETSQFAQALTRFAEPEASALRIDHKV